MQLTLNLPNPLAARQSLFMSTDGLPYTTSRAVAERFGKNHRDVLKAIKNLLADMPDPEFSRRNFAPRDYLDGRGKTQPEYRLTHDGFAVLAMRFTGRDALAWQIAFLQAFNALESELSAQRDRYVGALDILCPPLRPAVECTQAGQARTAIASVIGKSCASVTYYRAKARRLGLLSV